MAKSSDIIKIGFDYRASLEQFIKETNGVFDGISEKAGKQRISIQLDAKNDKVIEKIKELQKLKLDKFTFEFGESGLAEQLKTFDQLEKKITEIINLSKGINNIGSGNGIGNSIVDEKSLNSIIDLFGKMESHLGEIKKIFADVGDGGEFSPLLSTIEKVNSSIKELNNNTKNIGLNMSIDVGSNKEMETKFQEKTSKALIAYQRLFEHIKSTTTSQLIFDKFNDFNLDNFDTTYGKAKAIADFIERARNDSKLLYNGHDVLKEDSAAKYWNQASAAMGQATKVLNEMKTSADTSPLENLFGKTDLTEVIIQLNLIVNKLGEISAAASEFKNVFANGFNVSASVEEIEKLTNRVRELEDELSKVKVSSTAPIKDTFQGDKIEEAVKVADQLEEEIQEITVATDKAGKALEEYKEKWKVLKQIGDVGDDKYSATFKRNDGQIESVTWKAKKDDEGNVLFDSNGEKEYEMLSVTISNYQKLESVIVSADNELRKLEDRRKNLLKQNPTASTSGLDAQIAYQKNYISLLEQTVKHISQADEYLLEEQQIIEARNKAEKEYQLTKGSKQDESVAKDYQKRNDAITKANRLLNTQEKTVKHIAKTYDKALNPDLEKSVNNPNDLAELAQKKSEIQTLINQLKNAPRDASNEQEYLRLEKLIAEYKDLADYKKKANNPTKQELGGQKLETLVAQTVSEYDKLIIRAEKYGDATKEIVEKLKQQRDLLAQTDSNGKYTANANDFYSARDVLKVQKADFGVFEASEKAIKIREKELEAVRKLSAEKQKLQEKDRQYTVDSALKDQLSAWKDIQNIREKIAKTTNEEELSILNQQKKNAQQQYLSAEKVLKANVDLYDNEARLKQLEDVRLETNRKLVAYGETQVKAIGNLVKNEQTHLDKLRPSDGNRSVEFENTVQEYNKAIIALREFHKTLDSSTPLTKEQSEKYDELASSLQEARVEMEKFSASEKGSTEGSRWKEIDKITKYLEKNTRISKIAKQRLEDLVDTLKNVSGVNVDNIHLQFNKIAESERVAGREGKRFWDILTDKAVYGAAAQLAGYYLSLTDFIRYAQNGIQTIREFDTALTEMRKVSDETVSTLERFQDVSFDLADGVGTTAKAIQDATADWMRLGESLEEAKQSAQDANVLFRVSEFESIDEATESLVAMSAAYKDLEKSQINDVLNEIGNNYAISTDELASALQKSAATLSVAGNDIYEAAALVTAGNAVLQDADSVGTGLKMISLRILGTQEAKDELASLGEDVDDFVVQTKSKIDETVRNFTAVASNDFKGISVLDDNGNYRSTYEILRDISQVYQEILETDKKAGTNRGQALLEVLAGKNRSNVAASILQSPELLTSAYESAMKSAGSAQEELDKFLESIDGRMAKLENQAQEFWFKFIDSDTIKNGITLLTELLGLATDFVDTFGALSTAGVGIGAYLGIKNVGIGMLVAY